LPNVSDASAMTEMRMADLMEMKSYTKLVAKQSKQLETLRRKHEKVSFRVLSVFVDSWLQI